MGNSGFVLTDGPTTLLIDPAVTSTSLMSWVLPFQKVQSDPRELTYWSQRCDINKVDATLVNHTHTDHAIDAPAAVRKFGGNLVGSESLRQIGLGQGIPDSAIQVVHHGSEWDVGAFHIQAFSTPHAPHLWNILFADGDITSPVPLLASPWRYRVGETYSYWITHPEGKILFQAPGRVYSPDALAGLKPDTLLLTIANRRSSEELIQKRVIPSGATQVIPLHWDNFFSPLVRDGAPSKLWFQKTEEFDARFKALAPQSKLQWPEYCKPIPVGRQMPR
jgi:L-ascorbate metabolism protein UlaG (beta-lactamase superfamily)